VDEHLGRAAPRLHRPVPLDQKFGRNGHEIGRLAAPSALLGVGAAAVKWVVGVDTNVGGLKKNEMI